MGDYINNRNSICIRNYFTIEIQVTISLIEAEIIWNGLPPETSNIINQVRSDDASRRLRYKVPQITQYPA